MNHNLIQKMATSQKAYEGGRTLYLQNKVRLESAKSFWKDSVEVRAMTGEHTPDSQSVKLTINGGKITSFRCSCFLTNHHLNGLCAHGVAAALAWTEVSSHGLGQSDRSVNELVTHYDELRLGNVRANYVKEELDERQLIQVMPLFYVEDHQLKISLKLGSQRFFPIKDITDFLDLCSKGEYCRYGDMLKFYHVETAFTSESWALIQVLMEIDQKIWEDNRVGLPEKDASCYLKGNSQLLLKGADLDHFIAQLTDTLVETEGAGSTADYVELCREDPELDFTLQYINIGNPSLGAKLILKNHIQCFAGSRHLYILEEEKLWVTSEAYCRTLGLLLHHIEQNDDFVDAGIRVSAEDLPAFAGSVLTSIEPYVNLFSELDLDELRSKRLRTEFFFDVKGDLEVTLEIRHHYGNMHFNPVMGGKPSVKWRDLAGEHAVSLLAGRYFEKKYLDQGLLTTKDNEEMALNLIADQFEAFYAYGEVHVSDALMKVRVHKPKELRFHVQASSDWLDLQVNLDGIDPKELNRIMRHYEDGKHIYNLKNGNYALIQDKQIRVLNELMEGLNLKADELIGQQGRIFKARAGYLKQVFERHDIPLTTDGEFDLLIDKLLHKGKEPVELPKKLTASLRDYQVKGFQWLVSLYRLGFGGILADDMGLGKTVQMIALIAHIYEQEEAEADHKPTLIVCPASLLYNWQYEFKRFAPEIRTRVITGEGRARKKQLEEATDAQVWITSYDMLRRDLELYLSKSFALQVLDEAQYIKNQSTKTARSVKRIPTAHRFALTGTPVENHLGELWSIFDFLMPGYLYNRTRFHKLFESALGKENEDEALKKLADMTAPFVLRRMKKQVLQELPEKCDTNLFLPLAGEQKKLYAAFALQLKKVLMKETDESYLKNRTNILASLTRLREICCAPELIVDDFNGSNAKLEAMMELIEACVGSDHPVLVFSQFTRMLDLIKERLDQADIPHFMLTGQTDKALRQELVDRFEAGEVPVFLISLKAGGNGLNLTKADTVIHYDPWWNLAAQNQATDRAYRIGQTREVNVYHLIASETIEENILVLQDAKQNLVDQVITGKQVNLSELSREALMDLL